MGSGTGPAGGEAEQTRGWLGVWSQEDTDHGHSRHPGRSQVSRSGQVQGPRRARLSTSPPGRQRAEPRTRTSRDLEQGSLQPARELLWGGRPQACPRRRGVL